MSARPHWEKLGRIYSPENTTGQCKSRHPKLLSHAANPLPVRLDGNVYRIFYSGRDAANRSSVGAVDIDIVSRQVVHDHEQPFFEHGPSGSFYEAGVSIGNCYEADGVRYMGFMGWQNPPDGHWRGDIGRLILNADMTLQIASELPLLAADAADPISLSYPCVTKNKDENYTMWYGSTIAWDAGNGEMLHVINHATSEDGQMWVRCGLAVPYLLGTAQAFSRPTVVCKPDKGHEMWFSYRGAGGQKYRIGYAHSVRGNEFELDLNSSGIDVSPSGWDSEMLEYPSVFDHDGQQYMLYNGNGYGKTGFGLAVYRHG